jgi:hypothetical protein
MSGEDGQSKRVIAGWNDFFEAVAVFGVCRAGIETQRQCP